MRRLLMPAAMMLFALILRHSGAYYAAAFMRRQRDALARLRVLCAADLQDDEFVRHGAAAA